MRRRFALSMVSNAVKDDQREIWVYSENGGEEFNYLVNRDTVSGKYIMIQRIEPVRLVRGWQTVRLSVDAGEGGGRNKNLCKEGMIIYEAELFEYLSAEGQSGHSESSVVSLKKFW